MTIQSFDERRDIVIPGDYQKALEFSVQHFIKEANEAIAEKGLFSVALSGGSTPNAIYRELAKAHNRDKIDWSKVLLFWSDERYVPLNDPENNSFLALQAGLSSLPIPKENIFRFQTELEPDQAAQAYQKCIEKNVPNKKFDLMMLGMGEDGHVASLFPKTHGLTTENKLVIANFVPQKSCWRLTMTFSFINQASHIVLYVFGKNKADVLYKVLHGPYQPELLPAQAVGTTANKALFILDTAAAHGN